MTLLEQTGLYLTLGVFRLGVLLAVILAGILFIDAIERALERGAKWAIWSQRLVIGGLIVALIFLVGAI